MRNKVWQSKAMFDNWKPLIGERYATQISSIYLGQVCSVGGILFCILAASIVPFIAHNVTVGLFVGLAFSVCLFPLVFLAFAPIVGVANQIKSDLESDGYTVTHTPPLQSRYAFPKWLATNQLSAALIEDSAKRHQR